jgi:hypothetical protein
MNELHPVRERLTMKWVVRSGHCQVIGNQRPPAALYAWRDWSRFCDLLAVQMLNSPVDLETKVELDARLDGIFPDLAPGLRRRADGGQVFNSSLVKAHPAHILRSWLATAIKEVERTLDVDEPMFVFDENGRLK